VAVTDIYLVSEHIAPVSSRSIDQLERAIGSLPLGYREFMNLCGCHGELCSEVRVWHPEVILAEVERARADQTLDSCTVYSYPGRLTLEDFRGLWPFGSTVNGDRLVYLPRQPGVLFNIHRNADRISRHPHAYELAWCLGVHCVRMPRSSYGDTVMVFVKRIGGLIQFTYEPENNLDEVYGGTSFDRGFTKEVKAFEQKLHSEVGCSSPRSSGPSAPRTLLPFRRWSLR
jgi:hypothetical protein